MADFTPAQIAEVMADIRKDFAASPLRPFEPAPLTPAPAPAFEPPAPAFSTTMDSFGGAHVTLSPERLSAERAAVLSAWDSRAATARFNPHDAALYTPERRAAFAAEFDRACAADGMTAIEPPSADVIRHHDEHALPFDPKPQDYRPVFSPQLARDLPAENLANVHAETTAWAAAVGFAAPLGTAIVERIAELGPKLRDMTPEARADWIATSQRNALRLVGSQENLDQMRVEARAALAIAGDNPFGKGVANSTLLNDPWLTLTLANHARAVAAFARSHPDDRRRKK
jgi:hypothetical protein